MSIILSLIALVASVFATSQADTAIQKATAFTEKAVQEQISYEEKIKEIVEQRIENLGGQNAVGGDTYYLSGSGVSATQTTIGLTKFGYTRPDGSYVKFLMSDFGDKGCGTVRPGNNSGKQEFVSFDGVTQNPDGSATLTGAIRGLERVSPYTASSTLRTSHSGGSILVISNTPPCFYQGYTNRNNVETIYKSWIFASTSANWPGYDSLPTSMSASTTALASVGYVNSVAVSGAPDSSPVTKGITEQATGAEAASSKADGTGNTTAPLGLTTSISSSSPVAGSSRVVVTQSTGYMNVNMIATSSTVADPNIIRFGQNIFFNGTTTPNTGTTTFNVPVDIDASVSNPVKFNGATLNFPATEPASTTVLAVGEGGTVNFYNVGDLFSYRATSTYQAGGVTGNQVIPHNLGRVPRFIEVHARSESDAATGGGITSSVGMATSTATTGQNVMAIGQDDGGGAISGITKTGSIVLLLDSAGTTDAEAVLAEMSATTVTLNWTANSGTPPDRNRYFILKIQ